jgi:uncharacterized protein
MIYTIKMIEGMGRGIVATKDIAKGQIVTRCEILILSKQDTPMVNNTDLQWYTFSYSDGQDCLVLGDGEIFNHDDAANVDYSLVDFDGRKLMQFVANKEIKQGEQLFIDYSADVEKVDVSGYINNGSLV